VREDSTFGRTDGLQSKTSSYFLAQRVGAGFHPTDALLLGLDLRGTRYFETSSRSAFTAWLVSANATYELSDHFALFASGTFSPRSQTWLTIPLTLSGASSPTSVKLSSTSSSYSGELGTEWGTNGDSNYETVVEASTGLLAYNVTEGSGGKRNAGASLGSVCGSDLACRAELASILGREDQQTYQGRLSLGVTETLHQDTDLGLMASYYAYATSVTQQGQARALLLDGPSAADGLPILPLHWAVQPSLLHRFNGWSVSAYGQYAPYIDAAGHAISYGVRGDASLTKTLKLRASANQLLDYTTDGLATRSTWATLGLRLSF